VIHFRWSTRAPGTASSINSTALTCPQTFACSSPVTHNQCVPNGYKDTRCTVATPAFNRVQLQVNIAVHIASCDANMTKPALPIVDVMAAAYHSQQAVSNFVDTTQPSLHRSSSLSPQSSLLQYANLAYHKPAMDLQGRPRYGTIKYIKWADKPALRLLCSAWAAPCRAGTATDSGYLWAQKANLDSCHRTRNGSLTRSDRTCRIGSLERLRRRKDNG
jgi:hypothetical protein